MAPKALLLALCLCFAWVSPALPAAKSGSPVAVANPRTDVTDFGARWTAMSNSEKEYFLIGMDSAFRLMCNIAVNTTAEGEKDPKVLEQRFFECLAQYAPFKITAVKDAMTALYADRANRHIAWDDMYGYALLRVAQKPYEDKLADARKRMDAMADARKRQDVQGKTGK